MVVPIYVIPAYHSFLQEFTVLVDVCVPSNGFSAALPGSFQVTSYNPKHPLIGLG
jgi:hypothetical protein